VAEGQDLMLHTMHEINLVLIFRDQLPDSTCLFSQTSRVNVCYYLLVGSLATGWEIRVTVRPSATTHSDSLCLRNKTGD